MHNRKYSIGMIRWYVNIADHPFTAGNTFSMTSFPVMLATNKMAFFPGSTFFGDRGAPSMAGEVMDCQTVLRVLRTPFIFSPSVTVVIVNNFVTGKTLEAAWKWSRVYWKSHIIEIDVLGQNPIA